MSLTAPLSLLGINPLFVLEVLRPHVCHIIWVLGMESCWCPGYQWAKLFMYPPECTGAPLAAMLMSHREHGEEEDGGGGARWSPSGPQGPFFMIFLYLDRLFWNHIFTCRTSKREQIETIDWDLWSKGDKYSKGPHPRPHLNCHFIMVIVYMPLDNMEATFNDLCCIFRLWISECTV